MGVTIDIAAGGLGGTLQTADGVAGLVMTGGIDEGGYTLGTPVLVTGLPAIAAVGITEEGNIFAVRQLKQFYAEAGDGAQLYVMLVPNSMNIDDICDPDNDDGAVKLLRYADGKIRLLGVMTSDSLLADPVTQTDGLNADIPQAMANMKILATSWYRAHQPFRAIIGSSSYNGVAGDLDDLTRGDNNRTAVLIGDTAIEGNTETGVGCVAALGLVLGRAAKLPVQRKISRVLNGTMAGVVNAYVGPLNATDALAALNVIAGGGYITWQRYANQSGWYMSGDPMATSTADDYCMLARGRVIDKAHVLAYATFVQAVDDEVPVNADGTLDSGFVSNLEQGITNQINNSMTANGEISSVSCYINPAQNILSTNELRVVLTIVPVGYASNIIVTLGFANPALA